MARSEEVLSIFLASPGDLTPERTRLVDVIRDWNRTWSRELAVRLELLRWEDDAFPDIGDDGQDVINRQIPADWDLFIGMMWSRFGSVTGRAGSGTEEEFLRALERHRNATGSVGLLFYFKDAPIAPSKVDTTQLQQVQRFKQSVQDSGLLTWDFTDTDQFEKLVSLHVTRHVQNWRRLTLAEKPEPIPSPTDPAVTSDLQTIISEPLATSDRDDEEGYLDLLEIFSERSAEMSQIALRIGAAQQTLTAKTEKGRIELEDIRANPSSDAAKRAKSSILAVAQEMLAFTSKLEEEIPLFRSAVDGGFSTLTRVATISAELYPEQLQETKSSAFGLLSVLISARQATEGFRDSTANLPRMTKDLNLAKRRQVAALDSLIAEFQNGEKLLAEAVAVVDNLIRQARPASAQ